MANTRLSAFFSLLLVFASGVIVGVFGYRVYASSVEPPAHQADRRPDPEEMRKRLIAEMRSAVKLNDDQVAKLSQIYDQTRDSFRQSQEKWNSEGRSIWENQTRQIEDMLRPEQVPLYKALREKKERDREAQRKAYRKGSAEGIRKDR